MTFKVFYADGTERAGESLADWQALPAEGVLAVVVSSTRTYGHPRRHAADRHAYRDYYWMLADGTISSGAAKHIPRGAHIKRGRYLPDREWEDVYNNRIMVDPLVE